MSRVKTAVVILNWNGKSFLEEFLPSVVDGIIEDSAVFIADNASTDDSIQWVRDNYPQVHIRELSKNLGFAGGYNQALSMIDAEYFLLLNQDVRVDKKWLKPLVDAMDKNPDLGAIQPKIRAEFNHAQFEYAGASGGYIDSLGYPFCRGRIFDKCETDNGQYDEVTSIFWATGAALMIRADLYLTLGGLDTSFFAHMEEIDLCWRVKRCGYDIQVIPSSIVYHVGGGSLPKENPKKTYLNFRNNLAMMVKNDQRKIWWLIICIRLFLDGLAGIQFIIEGKFKHALMIVKAHFYIHSHAFALIHKRGVLKKLVARNKHAEYNKKGLYRGSIIQDHFIKGRKKFSELPPEKFY